MPFRDIVKRGPFTVFALGCVVGNSKELLTITDCITQTGKANDPISILWREIRNLRVLPKKYWIVVK